LLQFGPLVRGQCDCLRAEWHITLDTGSMLIVSQRQATRGDILSWVE
jgi:hypothetical protein